MDPSQSFTILPYINAPCGAFDALNATNSLDNNFSVLQTFKAGVLNESNLTVLGTSRFTGICTFDSVPQFDSGIEVDFASLNTGSLTVEGLSSLEGGLRVQGIVELPAGTINQSEVLGGYCDLVNDQSIAGVKSFVSPPVLSGASIAISTIPAASVVDKSLTDSQIALAGISQSSVAGGYLDLVSAQFIAGDKEFSGATRLISGLTVIGNSAMDQVQCGQIYASDINVNNNVSALTFTGDLNGNAATCSIASNVIVRTDNNSGSFAVPFIKTSDGNDSIFVDDAATPFMTYNPSSGLLSSAELAATVVARLANVILPSSVTVCSTVSGVLTIPLAGFSLGNFSHLMNANITTILFTGAVVGSRTVLVLTGSASATRTLQKNVSTGGFTIRNNLSGNTNVSANSVWICNIFVISSTSISMVWSNIT
jgi:hypothetical protein